MTAFEMAPAAPPPSGWTIADVDALPDNGVRFELIDGVPHAMTPPKLLHQLVQRRLANALEGCAPAGLVVAECVGVVLASDQRPIPDVVVLAPDADLEKSNFPADQVLLVVEVVSPSSRSDDRFRKPALYADAGIPVYMRVELSPLHVMAYAIGADGVYVEVARAEAGEVLTLAEPFPIAFDPAVLDD